jgi:hypothetical protein
MFWTSAGPPTQMTMPLHDAISVLAAALQVHYERGPGIAYTPSILSHVLDMLPVVSGAVKTWKSR